MMHGGVGCSMTFGAMVWGLSCIVGEVKELGRLKKIKGH